MQEDAEGNEEEVVLTPEQKFLSWMLIPIVIDIAIVLIWSLVREQMESGISVNIWAIQAYESFVVAACYGVLIVGFVLTLCCAYAERHRACAEP